MFLLTPLCPDLPLPFCDHFGGVHWLFQGLNFSGADLSRLDLRYINFKMANLSRCNLAHANLCCANLERADLSGSVLDVRMLCPGEPGLPCSCPKKWELEQKNQFPDVFCGYSTSNASPLPHSNGGCALGVQLQCRTQIHVLLVFGTSLHTLVTPILSLPVCKPAGGEDAVFQRRGSIPERLQL